MVLVVLRRYCAIIEQLIRSKIKVLFSSKFFVKVKGFTLIELLIVITMMLLVTGGTIVFVNRSNSEQKIAATKNELIGNLRMARNYARTLQVPSGYVGNLEYVVVSLNTSGQIVVYPNPWDTEGVRYIETDISPSGVGTSMYPNQLFFAAYEGKLLKVEDGRVVPRGSDEMVTIVISSTEGVGNTESIIINSVGLLGGGQK